MNSRFLLHHVHQPGECAIAFAAWKGFRSPLRHLSAPATCLQGGHAIWWVVEAQDTDTALGQLPPYLAARTEATPISEVQIP